MQTKPKTQAATQTRKTFQWGISSTDVSFLQRGEVEQARHGTDCGCGIAPLPLPKAIAPQPAEGEK